MHFMQVKYNAASNWPRVLGLALVRRPVGRGSPTPPLFGAQPRPVTFFPNNQYANDPAERARSRAQHSPMYSMREPCVLFRSLNKYFLAKRAVAGWLAERWPGVERCEPQPGVELAEAVRCTAAARLGNRRGPASSPIASWAASA